MLGPVRTWMGDRLRAGIPVQYVPCQVNSDLHPSGVAQSSTSFGGCKGGNVTSARCDPIWHVSSCSDEASC